MEADRSRASGRMKRPLWGPRPKLSKFLVVPFHPRLGSNAGHFRLEHSRKRVFSGISPNLDHQEPWLVDSQQTLAKYPFRGSQPSWPAHRPRSVVGQRWPIAAPQAALCGDRALVADADMPTMIATGQHLAELYPDSGIK